MKDFPDMKSNALATEATDNINQEEQENFFDVEKVIKMRVSKKRKGRVSCEMDWVPFESGNLGTI